MWRNERSKWVNSHLSPLSSPFSPQFGEEKKNTPKWWAQGKNILSLPKSTPQPNKVAIQISPYFPLPFFILP